MAIFFYILEHNIIPIFLLIGLGFFLSKKFDLNITTLSKCVFYLFTPAFIAVNLYNANVASCVLKILFFCLLYSVTMDILSRAVAKIRGFEFGMTNAFKNSVMFNNTGNIGLSLVTLVFSSGPFLIGGKTPYLSEALSAMIIIVVYMNITTNTLGFFYAGRATMNFGKSVKKVLAMPMIYVVPTILLIKYIHFDLESTFLWPTMHYLSNGLVAMALITLGVQLSKTKFHFRNLNAHISAFARLVIGPILAVLFLTAFGFSGVTAQTILIAYSVPTAVNTALIAVECNNNKDFATQAVVLSTVFSMATLTIVIYAARILYPV